MRLRFFPAVGSIAVLALAGTSTVIAQQSAVPVPVSKHKISIHPKFAPDGNGRTFSESVMYSFSGPQGSYGPSAPPVAAPDGNYWGASMSGGQYGYGEIFSYSPKTGAYTGVYELNGTTSGGIVAGGLYVGQDGALYGTTLQGGTNNGGTLFRMGTGGAFKVLYNFASGANPGAGVIQDSAGNFYGTTSGGGKNSLGNLWEFSTSGSTYTDLWDCSATDCAFTYAPLVQAANGSFYGTSVNGGQNGTIFSFTPGSALDTIYSCQGNGDCQWPTGGLVQQADGSLWGHSSGGGANGVGNVFEIADGSYWNVVDLNNSVGVNPYLGTLELAGDGNFYGTTALGSTGNGGAYEVTSQDAAYGIWGSQNGTDAQSPAGDLVEMQDGSLWGASLSGGAKNQGALFRLTASPALPPTISLTASASSITFGSPVTLTYSVNNAYSLTAQQCYAFTSGGTTGVFAGALGTSGSVTVTPRRTGAILFAYTCGGSQTATATVNVNAKNIISFTSVTHNFGDFRVGTSSTGQSVYGVMVTNNSNKAFPVSVSLSNTVAFSYQSFCGTSIPAGGNCVLKFTFAPKAVGTVSSTWSLAAQSGFSFSPSNGGTLSGTGIPYSGLLLTTSKHNFGTVAVGSKSAVFGAVLTNATMNSLPITITPTGATGSFITTWNNCPATLAPGGSCNLQYEFAPQAAGFVQAVYEIQSSIPVTVNGVAYSGLTLVGNGQ